jgi:hypothetical protein
VPGDGRFPVRVMFKVPGTFVLQVLAHDGGLAASQNVTVNVEPRLRHDAPQWRMVYPEHAARAPGREVLR